MIFGPADLDGAELAQMIGDELGIQQYEAGQT